MLGCIESSNTTAGGGTYRSTNLFTKEGLLQRLAAASFRAEANILAYKCNTSLGTCKWLSQICDGVNPTLVDHIASDKSQSTGVAFIELKVAPRLSFFTSHMMVQEVVARQEHCVNSQYGWPHSCTECSFSRCTPSELRAIADRSWPTTDVLALSN